MLELCKYLLLYTSSPAALVRLANTSLSSNFSHFCDLYKSQHHSSISDFLKYHIQSFWSSESRVGLLMQVLSLPTYILSNLPSIMDCYIQYFNPIIRSQHIVICCHMMRLIRWRMLWSMNMEAFCHFSFMILTQSCISVAELGEFVFVFFCGIIYCCII